MTSDQDKATQGWAIAYEKRYGARGDSSDHVIVYRKGYEDALAALQRPGREAEHLAEIESLERSEGREIERGDFMVKAAERNLARAEAAESREAALVEALRRQKQRIDGDGEWCWCSAEWVKFNGADVHSDHCLVARKALISPLGLSEGG